MFTPEGLADALKHSRRKLKSIRPDHSPHDHARVRAILDARPDNAPQPAFKAVGLSDVFLVRPPKPAPRSAPDLTTWQALRSLFNQEWSPPDREDRPLRVSAGFISVVMNLLFFAMLLYLMYWKFMMPTRPDIEESIRVQMIGMGAPDVEGGGAPEAIADIEVAASEAQSAQAAANAPANDGAAQSVPTDLSHSDLEATRIPTAQATVPLHSQVAPPVPHVETPEEVQPIIASKPVPTESDYRVPDVKSMPVPAQRPVELKPTDLPEVASLPMPAEAEPEPARVAMPNARIAPVNQSPKAMQASDLTGAVQSLPNPAPSTGTATQPGSATTTANATSTGGTQAGSRNAAPASAVGNKQGVAANAQGAGASNLPKQGSAPTALKGDDWGDAKKNVAGTPRGGNRGTTQGRGGNTPGAGGNATAGIFNADGSLRLPDQFKARPPDPYKEGSWLKRPGIVVQGTVFDKYWIPPGNLLEEWVRKGIKSISIPIPGTNAVLNCTVSLLQLGGGCLPGPGKNGVRDQPAVARPPPDVPFKRELFEDQSAVGPPKAAAAPATPANDDGSKPAARP